MESMHDPQVRANDFIVTVDHPTHGPYETLATPLKFSESEVKPRGAAPEMGQHTEQVLVDELGYSWDEIESLRRHQLGRRHQLTVGIVPMKPEGSVTQGSVPIVRPSGIQGFHPRSHGAYPVSSTQVVGHVTSGRIPLQAYVTWLICRASGPEHFLHSGPHL